MSTKFEQAIDESLRAVQTYEQAVTDIHQFVKEMDRAVDSRTKGQIDITARLQEEDPVGESPISLVEIVAGLGSDPTQNREVCRVQPSRTGYPVVVCSFHDSKTLCPDFESLESQLADIMRDPRFGLKLKTLMELAEARSAARPSAPETPAK